MQNLKQMDDLIKSIRSSHLLSQITCCPIDDSMVMQFASDEKPFFNMLNVLAHLFHSATLTALSRIKKFTQLKIFMTILKI